MTETILKDFQGDFAPVIGCAEALEPSLTLKAVRCEALQCAEPLLCENLLARMVGKSGTTSSCARLYFN